MTDSAELTDEELAELESWALASSSPLGRWIPRLIAALRAKSAELELHRSRAERSLELRRENGLLQAEVERLREDARENYARAERAEQALIRERANR